MEVEALALKDEGTHAILCAHISCYSILCKGMWLTWDLATALIACSGIIACYCECLSYALASKDCRLEYHAKAEVNVRSSHASNASPGRSVILPRPVAVKASTLLLWHRERELSPATVSVPTGTMTDKLPPQLLSLFTARPALRWLPQADFPPEERRTARITGVAQYLPQLKEEFGNYVPTESWLEKKDKMRLQIRERQEYLTGEGFKEECTLAQTFTCACRCAPTLTYNLDKPSDDPQIRGDPFKTLIISRLSYDAETKDIERLFAPFGPIERIRIVTNTKASPTDSKKKRMRGYAFVVFERERDMKGKCFRSMLAEFGTHAIK